MRKSWPDNKPMRVRISASDWDAASSWNVGEATVFSTALEALGCDWIDVSSVGVSRAEFLRLYLPRCADVTKARCLLFGGRPPRGAVPIW